LFDYYIEHQLQRRTGPMVCLIRDDLAGLIPSPDRSITQCAVDMLNIPERAEVSRMRTFGMTTILVDRTVELGLLFLSFARGGM